MPVAPIAFDFDENVPVLARELFAAQLKNMRS